MMNKMLLILCLIGVSHSNAALLNTELVTNRGAENGDTTGWVSTGIDAVTPPDTFAQGFGSFVFTGGTGPTTQTLLQTIDVSGNSGQISIGEMKSIFSVNLQSRSSASTLDVARADVSFIDGSGGVLDSFSFEDNINTASFDWNFFSDTRLIPGGTQSIEILLTASRNGGLSSDAFFDDVSLQLNAVPLPAAVWLFVSGMIGLLGLRKLL